MPARDKLALTAPKGRITILPLGNPIAMSRIVNMWKSHLQVDWVYTRHGINYSAAHIALHKANTQIREDGRMLEMR